MIRVFHSWSCLPWACAGFRGSDLGLELAAWHCAAHYGLPSLRIRFWLLLCPRPNRVQVEWEFPWARRGEAREAEQRRPSDASRAVGAAGARLKSVAVLSCSISRWLPRRRHEGYGGRRAATPFEILVRPSIWRPGAGEAARRRRQRRSRCCTLLLHDDRQYRCAC